MKASSPVVTAWVLWLLLWATNAFAVLKSPYPPKAQPPDQIVSVTDGHVGSVAGTANKQK
jgi:hypothetical protein